MNNTEMRSFDEFRFRRYFGAIRKKFDFLTVE